MADFEAMEIRVFSIFSEPVETLARFAQEFGITYPLLSDEGSRVIREFGILNTLIQPEEAIYGIPYPGSYLVDENGRVIEKYFHREYQIRETAPTILQSGFHVPVDLTRFLGTGSQLPGAQVSVSLAARELRFMQRADLYVHLQLAEGLHVYGQPVPDGYYATEVKVHGPEGLRIGKPGYPPTRPLRVAGLPEEFHIFEGDLDIVVPLVWAAREGESVPIDIEVRYQACSDVECFLPETVRLHLDVPIGRLNSAARGG